MSADKTHNTGVTRAHDSDEPTNRRVKNAQIQYFLTAFYFSVPYITVTLSLNFFARFLRNYQLSGFLHSLLFYAGCGVSTLIASSSSVAKQPNINHSYAIEQYCTIKDIDIDHVHMNIDVYDNS